MGLDLVEPSNPKNSLNINLLINENYINKLNESIQNLLDEFQNGVSDTSSFASNVYELLQARVTPPLEAIWIYAALTFHSRNVSKDDLTTRFSNVKALFQLVSACSASCIASKNVALLAPVLHEVYNLVCELFTKDVSGKKEKKTMREIVSLTESIIGYINVCCDASNETNVDFVGTITSFSNLISVWIKGKEGESEGIESFFPLVSRELLLKLKEGEFDVNYLVGIVILESFLLNLCLKFRSGIPKQELEKDLINWTIGSITGLKNHYFFENLARMLLEPTLTVTSLLNFEEEKMMKKVLNDAVILVDYSFLNFGKEIQPHAEHMNSLALTRLIVTYEAIEFFRETGDSKRAISYSNVFSGSSLPSQLTNWVASMIGTKEKGSGLNGSSPKAILKWIINLENDHGIRIFDDSHTKTINVLKAKLELEQPTHELKNMKSYTDLFYVDNKGENAEKEEENESMNAAAKTMKNKSEKKRKNQSSNKKKQIKFVKYNL